MKKFFFYFHFAATSCTSLCFKKKNFLLFYFGCIKNPTHEPLDLSARNNVSIFSLFEVEDY